MPFCFWLGYYLHGRRSIKFCYKVLYYFHNHPACPLYNLSDNVPAKMNPPAINHEFTKCPSNRHLVEIAENHVEWRVTKMTEISLRPVWADYEMNL